MSQREDDDAGAGKDRNSEGSASSKKSKKAAQKKVTTSKKKKAEKKSKKTAAASTGAKGSGEVKPEPIVRSIVAPVARPAILSRHWNSMHRREARGYSFGELTAAGMNFRIAKSLRVPVDLRRRSVVKDNVDTLKEWYKPVERPKVAAVKPKRIKAKKPKKVGKIRKAGRAKKVTKAKNTKKVKKSKKVKKAKRTKKKTTKK